MVEKVVGRLVVVTQAPHLDDVPAETKHPLLHHREHRLMCADYHQQIKSRLP